jgi:hypothetical protein
MSEPSRLDHVQVHTADGPITISWDARDQLLERMRHLDTAAPVVRAFEAVGATRPVELYPEGKRLVLDVIETWGRDEGDIERLPDGIPVLRHALADELAGPTVAV